ncbi:MAG: hypothetical protein CL484_05815 [Acidobacteria bacterium]|nr:hypothetical protein [Acidobacteriota bacterium]
MGHSASERLEVSEAETMMWRSLVSVVTVWLVVGVSLLQAQSGVSGNWEMRLDTQTGVTTWQARFEQNGDRLGGEIDLGDNEVLSVDGTVEGSVLKFVIVVPDLDGDQPINFEGEVVGDVIQGAEGSFSWYGTGAWEASRE